MFPVSFKSLYKIPFQRRVTSERAEGSAGELSAIRPRTKKPRRVLVKKSLAKKDNNP